MRKSRSKYIPSRAVVAKLAKAYKSGKSLAQVAKMVGRSMGVISRILRSAKVKIRKAGRPKKQK